MMMNLLNLIQLKIFHSVPRPLSVTLAAKEPNLTQPGIANI